MPRRPRLVIPGLSLHLIQRGNNRSACFFAATDYRRYLDLLADQARRHDCAVHAWCLMTNHVHLLVTPGRPDSVGHLMKALGQIYVQYVNRRYQRSGTLWEGRFRSCLVGEEAYVLACHRYIELNPVRAGLVEQPGEYPWSSYRFNGQGDGSAWATPHPLYQALGATPAACAAEYRQLFLGRLDGVQLEQIRRATNGNFALGTAQFTAQVEAALDRRAIPGLAGRPRQNRRPK